MTSLFKQNNIIPFKEDTWRMLRYFQTDIREMEESTDGDYSVAIGKHKALYQDTLKEYKS